MQRLNWNDEEETYHGHSLPKEQMLPIQAPRRVQKVEKLYDGYSSTPSQTSYLSFSPYFSLFSSHPFPSLLLLPCIPIGNMHNLPWSKSPSQGKLSMFRSFMNLHERVNKKVRVEKIGEGE